MAVEEGIRQNSQSKTMETEGCIEKVRELILPLASTTKLTFSSSHMDSIRAIAFCPYEAALVTASEDNTAKVWNIGTLEDRHK